MPTEVQREKLLQEKFNCISARHLHEQRNQDCRRWLSAVDIMSIGLAIWSLPVRIAASEAFRPTADVIGEWVAGLVLFMSCVKMVAKWQESAEAHRLGLGKNIQMAIEAEQLNNTETVDSAVFDSFLRRAGELQESDRAVLTNVTEPQRKEAYRQALKEHNCDCPVCKTNPWKFVVGTCGACGGSLLKPKEEKNV